jgi:type IV secretory pathway TraG/TraD family ATPase VirD4
MAFAGLDEIAAKFADIVLNTIIRGIIDVIKMLIPTMKGVIKGINNAINRIFKGPPPPWSPTYPKAIERLTSDKPRGIFFGKQFNKYIIKPEDMDGHIMVVGGTGSGKSQCIVMPTIKYWKGSIFAVDVKGELCDAAAKKHKKHQDFCPIGR